MNYDQGQELPRIGGSFLFVTVMVGSFTYQPCAIKNNNLMSLACQVTVYLKTKMPYHNGEE